MISADYISHMGSDLTVVDAARVSFDKQSAFATDGSLTEKDAKLIKYLATHNHFTPFAHPQITLRETVPIFVARQRFKHVVGFCIAGDTQISFEKTHNQRNGIHLVSVAELYTKWTQETPNSRTGAQYGYRQQIQKKKLRVLNTQTDEFESGHILDVILSGNKDCYEVTLANGKKVTLTEDHQVFTSEGWSPLKDAIGLSLSKTKTATFSKHAELACNGLIIENAANTYKNKEWLIKAKAHHGCLSGMASEAGCTTHTIRKWLQKYSLQFDHLQNLCGVNKSPPWNLNKTGYKLNRVFTPAHIQAIKQARSGERSNWWKGGISSNRAKIGKWTKEQAPEVHKRNDYKCVLCNSSKNLEAHHIVPVYADESLAYETSNLTSLCYMCHKHIHTNNLEKEFAENTLKAPMVFKEKPKGSGNTLVARYSAVVSVKYVGVQPVYDISVDHPEHNFVGNGIVLHNCYNEVSRRYVSDEPGFYFPSAWRAKPEGSIKQGSGTQNIEDKHLMSQYINLVRQAKELYQHFIKNNVAPEQARMLLPQSMVTSYFVTGSLAAFARAYKLRNDPHAQLEIQLLADQWNAVIEPLFPVSWAALTA